MSCLISQENARGRFLKVSETFTRGYSRFQIFIPAEGMEEFNQHLQELIEQVQYQLGCKNQKYFTTNIGCR